MAVCSARFAGSGIAASRGAWENAGVMGILSQRDTWPATNECATGIYGVAKGLITCLFCVRGAVVNCLASSTKHRLSFRST